MTRFKSTRRDILQVVATGTVAGALGALQSGAAFGGSHRDAKAAVVPRLDGSVVRRGEENYETWRRSMIWHKDKPDRFPDMIAQATSVDDVKRVVRYAADNNMKVAMRSGGHNATGASLRDNGIVLDVSSLVDITIDTETQIARVGTGTRSVALTADAATKGLAFNGPHCPTVALGGFVLGGGIGWNYTHRGGFASLSRYARTSLLEVSEVRKRFGGTINDVALAVAAGAIGEYLADRGTYADLPLEELRHVFEEAYPGMVSPEGIEAPVTFEDEIASQGDPS